MLHIKRILVPVDFSQEAKLALKSAVLIAKNEKDAQIYLLHVLPYVVDSMYLISWTDDLVGLRWDQAKEDLAKWKDKVPKTISCTPLLRKGAIAEQIRRVCGEKDIQLVIMTTRERRGLARLIRPNASEATVRLVPCPVVVLHLNQKTAELVRQSV